MLPVRVVPHGMQGVITSETYMHMQVRVVPHGLHGGAGEAGGTRLLQLRNPWGKIERRSPQPYF